ncbi:MAG: 2Fe-2S iron-sulfur cluster binding domain-containing protein [bacterium]|nr:2Fe-2S iron-sulfur cluster binding domain-containing protein [bacterium]
MSGIRFFIDEKECIAREGQTVTGAARENGVFIPTLCDFKGLTPAGTCRMCTSKINGTFAAACTTTVSEGMKVENDTPELNNIRKAIVEMLFVEGNHQCAICEKTGNCDLQALAYRYRMLVSRFPYQFPVREIESLGHKILIDTNRCIQCMRCVRGIVTPEGKHIFKMKRDHKELQLSLDPETAPTISDKQAIEAMHICPVGAILGKGSGYATPIGKRKYDSQPIGSEINKENSKK